MRTTFMLIVFTALAICSSFAQRVRFIRSGTIEFEKRINMFALIAKTYGENKDGVTAQVIEQYKKTQPQFKALIANLSFNDHITVFTPEPEPPSSDSFFDLPMAHQHKITYNDLRSHSYISQRTILGETFLIKDTSNKIKWKLTGETRDIAGYICHRANGLTLDSVYVVAFYTDQIPVSGGPESFFGLPGMILGIALPYENVTWFATKVTNTQVPALNPPGKGKQYDNKGFRATIAPLIKNGIRNQQSYYKSMEL